MLKFYYSGAPNPTKVASFWRKPNFPMRQYRSILARGSSTSRNTWLSIQMRNCQRLSTARSQFSNRTAILLYLAEKTGKFLPAKSDKARGELLSWLMFVATGVGPYSGQSVHFRNFAPEKIEYAVNRYAFEAQRHFGIIDTRLGKLKYMLGDVYTIVDMDVWGWARLIPKYSAMPTG